MLGLADDAPLAAPTLERAIGEVFELANRLTGSLVRLLNLIEFAPQDFGQPLVFRQPKHIIHAVFLAPGHQVLAAETAVAAEDDPHTRPPLADVRHDPSH